MEYLEKIAYDKGEIIFTDNYARHIDDENSILVIDSNVYDNYKPFNLPKQIILRVDEINKNLDSVNEIYSKLLEFGTTRKTKIYSIGGGITCDIAGFAAATFLRGIPITMIPTTLLSQADASVGGKNGVNFANIKNIIGTIRQPEKVIIDTIFLKTLKKKQISDGYAEIIKIAAVMDAELFEILENISVKEMFDCQSSAFKYILKKAVSDKLEIVRKDEKEVGLRRILNFGHTLAHAIEPVYGMSHGEAVAIGMVFATRIAEEHYEVELGIAQRVQSVLKKAKLPVERKICPNSVLQFIVNDKKRENDFLNFILLKSIGEANSTEIKISVLEKILHDMYEC